MSSPAMIGEAGAVPVVRISCLHGDEGREFVRDKWQAVTTDAPIEAAYAEAVRRLPVDDMPDLVECIGLGGHCLGLLDPVSNVILNSLNLLSRRRSGTYSPPADVIMPRNAHRRNAWSVASFHSYMAIVACIRAYFRYATEEQARRYIHLSGGDLVVAIRIAELEQSGAVRQQEDNIIGCHPDLFRDRARFALKVAAVTAEHPMPEDVALLCQPALQEPSEDMRAVLATLEEGRRLTVDDVQSILGVLQSQHRKTSAQLKLTIPRSKRGPVDSGEIFHYSFNTNGGGGGVVAVTFTFQCRASFNLANLRSPEIVRRKIESCLASIPQYTPHTPTEVADASPTCQHIELLKSGLLDTIHAFYMTALARLPRTALRHLLRGVLVAGHCYGPMDPVSNIIIHAVWYSIVAPQLHSECCCEPDILGVAALLRLEVRSLDGLIAIVREATGFAEHRAVEYLCASRCDVTDTLRRAAPETRGGALRLASEAAKHALEEHHSSFLASLASDYNTSLLDTLSSLLRPGEADLISDETITQLQGILGDRYTTITPVPALNHGADLDSLRSKKQSLEKRQSFLRKELQELLHCYADQHPWEPIYKLETICGFEKGSDYRSSGCYHINFLAVQSDGSAPNAPQMLFFAQVWEPKFRAMAPRFFAGPRTFPTSMGVTPNYKDSESEVCFCCPLPYYSTNDAYLGRCGICKWGISKIVHPPFGSHSGAVYTNFGSTGRPTSSKELSSRADDIIDSELIYCDDPTDTHFAKVLNDRCSSLNLETNRQFPSDCPYKPIL